MRNVVIKRSYFALILTIVLYALNACSDIRNTYEKEKSDLKNQAYDINYRFVNEVKLLSTLTKKVEESNLLNSNRFFTNVTEPILLSRVGSTNYDNHEHRQFSAGIDSLLLQKFQQTIFLSKVIISRGNDYFVYPKMNHEFLNREISRFGYFLDRNVGDKNLSDSYWQLTPVVNSFDAAPMVSYVKHLSNDSNSFVAGVFSCQEVFNNHIDVAGGTYMLIDEDGNVLAASDESYFITGLRKTLSGNFSVNSLRKSEIQLLPSIYKSTNESFRKSMFNILNDDKKTGVFRHSGREFTVLSSPIKQLKWHIIRIL